MSLIIAGCGDDNNKSDPMELNTNFRVVVDRGTDSFDVTDHYGALVVETGEFVYDTEMKPWSSWWYPSIDRDLFTNDDDLAPLEKYDEYLLLKHNKTTEAAHFEETKLYNPMQASWAGLCHAWAIASVLHREPRRLIRKEGMNFSIADQKALLLKSYENTGDLEIFGQRYDGLYDNDFQNIYPDQFHRFMQQYLRDEGKPFIMDYDPSYPVWTVPVYLAKTSIVEVDRETMSVTTWVTYASPFVAQNFVGTRQIVKTYTYNLYGSWRNGQFTVTDGEWTGASVYDHPDYVIAYPKNAQRGSYNKELEVRYIDEILK